MKGEFWERFKSIVWTSRRLGLLVLVILLFALFSSFSDGVNNEKDEVLVETSDQEVTEGPILEASMPVRLRIPKVSIDAAFVSPLDLEENGEVGVPDTYTEVGWYKHSPTPGQLGPSVILGHVDSYTGPAVFFSLGQLNVGDDIFVDREDGITAHFVVEELVRYKQSEFPTKKVYGDLSYAGLRLITCTGTYSKGEQRYSHNLVVYARLVE